MILKTLTDKGYNITSVIPDDNKEQEIEELKSKGAIEIRNDETQEIYFIKHNK